MTEQSRRAFLGAGLACLGAGVLAAQEEGKPAEMREYKDEKTGAEVRVLTPGPERDWVVYQTHPMWTSEMRHLMFFSERSGSTSIWAVETASGEMRPIVDGAVGAIVLGRKSDRLYWLDDRKVKTVRLEEAFTGKRDASEVTSLPSFAESCEGGFTLDANEDVLYTGCVLEKGKRWGILALHLESGAWRKVAETDFRVGHFQACPEQSGLIMFCWETGGDAPQRTWIINADGSGMRSAYKETYDEWVTHEVWWGKDRIIFTVWPYDEERTRKPHGIISADVATGAPTVHSQYKAWHTHGSPDGQWAVGDDFDRNLWLVKVATGERRLLTQGHLGEGFKTHPHPSFTPDGNGVVFSSSRSGSEDVCLVTIPEWESLPAGE